MAMQNSAATTSATNGQETQSAEQAQKAAAEKPVMLTAEQLKTMMDENRNTAFAEARRIFEGKQPPAKNKPLETDAEKTLREQVAELQSDRKAQQDEKRLLEIEKAAVKAGVDASRLDIFVDHVLTRHGSQIRVEGRKVVWTDALEQQRTLDDLIADVMKTRGDIFRPAARVPTARALQQGNSGQQRSAAQQPDAVAAWDNLSQAQIDKMSPEELRAHAAAAHQATREG